MTVADWLLIKFESKLSGGLFIEAELLAFLYGLSDLEQGSQHR